MSTVTVVAPPSGLLDPNFNSGFISGGGVRAITVQSDGKILIGGSFTNVQGFERNGIARLNADGRLDTSFGNASGISGNYRFVSSLALQSDGKVFVGGSFTNVHGRARPGVARLTSDGTVDMSFSPGTGPNGKINTLAYQTDGTVLVGGDFTSFNGVVHPGIVRLQADPRGIPPDLRVEHASGSVIFSWSAANGEYALEFTDDLSTAPDWRPVLAAPEVGGLLRTLVLPVDRSLRFFRLRKN